MGSFSADLTTHGWVKNPIDMNAIAACLGLGLQTLGRISAEE